ncbi:nicotinamide riboside transporter PnuC [Suttonella ornithocola]|uniref:Nicotinamide mononucleotide transporter n=1 Tax=Suttonella ornithocola TaxID=279832 RepID=A0A380MZB0_9GAMM|nr:nicotinamide riboside transporter PnuC [Suttonella ornithocola]SUO97642.1 Nicotinamide mononucleotide transporter [Suttonella ornithocola]
MNILDKITGPWQKQWSIVWFICGAAALFWGYLHELNYFLPTEESINIGFETFKLAVALIGMLCVLALAFRKNISGNGLGITANIGEVIAQGRSGATGLMLTPLYNMFTHLYALRYWAKNEDGDGNMIPKQATGYVWLITIVFIAIALFLFPTINDHLQKYSFIEKDNDAALSFAGFAITWYQINIVAFVIAVTAQTTMILRYSFSWWLWIASNFIWLAVNLANHNLIFATQTIIYQINCIVGIYEWWKNSRNT